MPNAKSLDLKLNTLEKAIRAGRTLKNDGAPVAASTKCERAEANCAAPVIERRRRLLMFTGNPLL
jgi:hypothetical protein